MHKVGMKLILIHITVQNMVILNQNVLIYICICSESTRPRIECGAGLFPYEYSFSHFARYQFILSVQNLYVVQILFEVWMGGSNFQSSVMLIKKDKTNNLTDDMKVLFGQTVLEILIKTRFCM